VNRAPIPKTLLENHLPSTTSHKSQRSKEEDTRARFFLLHGDRYTFFASQK
jgi:hypothetical protein